ncbi:MAG TPA: glutamine synthetase family protein [Solirubrobacteraceae bacterium]|jgi:glutamine synthetase|nr:glutamine synthetase family protein [Solirubrobacteraceae bacterium]
MSIRPEEGVAPGEGPARRARWRRPRARLSVDEVVALVDEEGLRLVRFLWCGNDGTIRAKATGRSGLSGRLGSGIGLTVAMQAMNSLDQLQAIEGLGPVGEVRLVPDLETFRVLPYAPHAGAVLTDHVALDGTPAPVCQRAFLKRMEARLGERGLTLRAAFENEFSLAHRADGGYVPVDSALCFSTIGMTAVQDYTDELAAALDEQWIVLEQCYAELGHGQQEISTGHAPALQAADEQLLVRETIRGVAARHDLVASLAPKPWPENAGNGCHIHFSLWEGERNRMYDTSASDGLSGVGRSFIAGVLAHLPGLCALSAPSFNSYHRILPHYWAGAFVCWGYDNREAPVRVASPLRGFEEASTNAELKAADASCNPYLALGGLIAAGLDGVERGLAPPAPVAVDPGALSEQERAAQGIARMPASQAEALDALAGDPLLWAVLGPELAESYLTVRRSEWEAYSAGDAAFEQQGHFEKY